MAFKKPRCGLRSKDLYKAGAFLSVLWLLLPHANQMGPHPATIVQRGHSPPDPDVTHSAAAATPEPEPDVTRRVVTTDGTPNFEAAFGVLIKFEPLRVRNNKKILNMLYSLSHYWRTDYPLLIFYEAPLDEAFRSSIVDCSTSGGLTIEWHDVTDLMRTLQGNTTQSVRWSEGLDGGSKSSDKPPSYRAMCRFWANEAFRLPRVARLDALVRLDDDSWFEFPVKELDPITEFRRRGLDYATRWCTRT